MKIDRLMALTIYLLNHGRTSAQKLAEKFEVSPRTIMRDIDTLDKAGIPIQSSLGVDGGFEIIDTFIMEKQLASKTDYDFIVTALRGLMSAYTNKQIEQTLAKMEALTDKQQNNVSIDFSSAHENKQMNELLQRLESAIEQEKIVQFQYTNTADEVKKVLVEPVHVAYKWYSWYLIGYYEKYQESCMFKLARMENLVITNKKITKKHEWDAINVNHNDTRNKLKIRFYGKAKIKIKCMEYLNGMVTKVYENGDFEFTFTVPENETYWYGVVLSMGSDIRVLEPQSLIERILVTCNDLNEIYGGEK